MRTVQGPSSTARLISYQLIFRLERSLVLQVGSLGRWRFPEGRYTYTGSGRRWLLSRIRRHLSRNKPLRWHIDYLLSSPGVHICRVLLTPIPECDLNQQTPGSYVVPGFGSSDCRRGCEAHLKFQGQPRAESGSRSP